MPAAAKRSFWESETFIGRPNVVIVGAGFTGLRAALALSKAKPDNPPSILVVDRHPFGLGASSRNAGFACFGSPTELLADLEISAAKTVWDTVERRYAGVQRLRKELIDSKTSNGREIANWQGGYEVFNDPKVYEKVMDHLPALNKELNNRLGPDAQWLPVDCPAGLQTKLPVLHNAAEGKIQPAEVLLSLQKQCRAAGIQLAYGCQVESLQGTIGNRQVISRELGTIHCDQVLIATNAFSRQLGLEVELEPCRNLVLLTAPIPGLELPGTYHHHEGYVYFRTIDRSDGIRVLIGGARHLDKRQETTADFGINLNLRKSLIQYLNEFLKVPAGQIKIEQEWSGIIAQGAEKSPIVERLEDGLVAAVRLSGMGVALSAEVGKEAAKILAENL